MYSRKNFSFPQSRKNAQKLSAFNYFEYYHTYLMVKMGLRSTSLKFAEAQYEITTC